MSGESGKDEAQKLPKRDEGISEEAGNPRIVDVRASRLMGTSRIACDKNKE